MIKPHKGMIKPHKGMILILTLVFVSLSAIFISQVTIHLTQNIKLLRGMGELVSLQLSQKNNDKAVEHHLLTDINWRMLKEVIDMNGTVNVAHAVNFDLLPTCSLLPESKWHPLTLSAVDMSKVYLRILSPAIMKGELEHLVLLFASCVHSENGVLGSRSFQIYEYSSNEVATHIATDRRTLPNRLL